jgi:apolipoprotein N-acyltransferase
VTSGANVLEALRLPLAARFAYPLAALCGLLYFLAFPGLDLWPLAFVALVPLMVALRGQPPRRALALGWLAGFVMTMSGFYWLLEMLQTFSGFPTALCLVFMAILCAYQAGRIGLLGFLCARAEGRGWPFGPVFAVSFAASELLYPLLFPWHYAATMHRVPAFLQLAELGGPIAVALVLVAANFALCELVFARLERRAVRWRVSAALAAVPALAAAYGAIRIPQVDARSEAAPKAQVGLVQANMSLTGKRESKDEGLRRHLALTRELTREGPLDLVVWSETSVMRAVPEEQAEREFQRRFTRSLRVPALFGGVLVRPVADEREYELFNSAILTDKQGKIAGRYDKQFLLAFGEYLPFGSVFPVLYKWSPNSGRFSPGTKLEPLPLEDRQIAVFICYEDIIPSFVNSIVRNGDPELLANLTNDAWFGDTSEPWIHLALAKLRAVEHRKYFVRSTNSGVSAFIDPVGRVVSHTSTFQQQALRAELSWLKGKTPYALYGDAPWWLASLCAVALALIRRRERRVAEPGTPEPVPPPDVPEPDPERAGVPEPAVAGPVGGGGELAPESAPHSAVSAAGQPAFPLPTGKNAGGRGE